MILIATVLVMPRGRTWPVPAWLLAACLGVSLTGLAVMLFAGTALGRGLSAVPIPNRHAVLRTEGLYRWVRHPIYSGLLLGLGATVVAAGSWQRAAAFGALVALLSGKARWEEGQLARRFPGYRDYAARTPRFVPVPRPRRREH
jgi:protein-S-isoprenylcysteine O-methyltransferase Ste14